MLCRDDPVVFADLGIIQMALKFSENYQVTVGWRLPFSIIAVLAATVILFFFARGVPRFRFRWIITAAMLLCTVPLGRAMLSEPLYERIQNYRHANQWSATQNYLSHGFLYPFVHSISAAFPDKPAGYSETAAKEILAAYAAEEIPAEKKVDVIAIQLEAFNDFTRMGVSGIAPEVYGAYHALEEESYTGTLVTNIFAGGTVDTERSVMTGYSSLDDFRHDVGSYVRDLRAQGYVTEGNHTSYDWFYNRKNINSYIGLEQYWYYENRYHTMCSTATGGDDILLPDILKTWRERDRTKPYFNLSVTYQGHGPYGSDALDRETEYWKGDGKSRETYYIFNNYLGSVADTVQRLSAFAEELRAAEDPVVLMLFGDHNPWLGYANSVYNELEINLDLSTEEGFYQYYGTRYLIWANDAAKTALGTSFRGEGPAVSPCYLMNLLYRQCGWGGSAYMQIAEEVMGTLPVINSNGFYVENGAVTRNLSEAAKAELNRFEIVQYYRKKHIE